ncbi:MAG TPA: endonuclease/exonuclease/phosphatase family protein [Chloroflexia bacterium]|nr:endonuclease/exonuclease/phosphatase family protein [Chloroflexia bacterium]
MSSNSSEMMAEKLKLRILTLNAWGVPLFSKDRADRLEAIAGQLALMRLDLAAIQEAWWEEDRQRLRQGGAQGGMPYSHYFPSGVNGSGLLVLSRYPIVDATFYRFRLASRPDRFPREQEYFGGKGIGLARIKTPASLLDFYDVHPVAQYTSDEHDLYRAHRAAAAYEIARFIQANSGSDHPAILCGDFNMRPDQFAYQALKSLAGLADAYSTLHPGEPGYTYAHDNPYASHSPESKRLDYIMLRDSQRASLQAESAEVVLSKSQSAARYKTYSDHYGVLAEVTLAPLGAESASHSTASSLESGKALEEIQQLLETALSEAQRRHKQHYVKLAASFFSEIVLKPFRAKPQSNQGLARIFSRLSGTFQIVYTCVQAWLALVVLPDEVHAFEALKTEIELQLKARRAFNDQTW